jgi:hypothetical protein
MYEHFRELNAQIMSELDNQMVGTFSKIQEPYLNGTKCVVVLIEDSPLTETEEETNRLSELSSSMCKVSNYQRCAHHVHRIKKLHFELHTLTQLINSTFGLQLFLALAAIFLMNIFSFQLISYFVMNLARNYYEVVETNYQGYIAVMWGTINSLLLFLVSVPPIKRAKNLPNLYL